MRANTSDDSADTIDLLHRAGNGDQEAVAALFAGIRTGSRRWCLRMDRRLQGRLDALDILQETYLEAAQGRCIRANPGVSVYLWLRLLASQKLVDLTRRHLGAKMRAGQEISLHRGSLPHASSLSLAEHLLGRLTSPSLAVVRAETQLRVQDALNAMDPIDREVLAWRHFELLSNCEVAQVLGLSKSAASNRYIRELKRHRESSCLRCRPAQPVGRSSHSMASRRGENMLDDSAERHPVELLAEDFLARERRGERPSLTEYVARYPDLAAEIHELFPVLLDIEGARGDDVEPPGRVAGPMTQPIERLGDYRISREVGRGGMGVVYEAEQESLGRRIALKVLTTTLSTPQQVRHFECEARSAARLHHTNIVPVFGVGHERCALLCDAVHPRPAARRGLEGGSAAATMWLRGRAACFGHAHRGTCNCERSRADAFVRLAAPVPARSIERDDRHLSPATTHAAQDEAGRARAR